LDVGAMKFVGVSDNSFWGYPLTKLILDHFRKGEMIETIDIFQPTIDRPMVDLSGPKTNLHSVLTLQNMKQFRNLSLTQKLLRNFRISFHLLRLMLQREPTILYVTTSRCLQWALQLKALFRSPIRILFHYFEMWEENDWKTARVQRICRYIDGIDGVLVPEQNRLDHLITRMPRLRDKAHLLPNTTTTKTIPQRGKGLPLHLLHVGAVGTSTYWKEVLDVVGTSNGRFLLSFVGYVESEVREYATLHYPQSVRFLGEVLHCDLEEHYHACDVGLILYRGTSENYEYAAPNKLYEFWSYGVPVLTHCLQGIQSQMKDSCLGVLADFDDPASIRDGLEAIARMRSQDNLSKSIGDLFGKELSEEILIPKVLDPLLLSFVSVS
jgi:glycosyltransferase involved in cell wall biosynthesis